MFSRKAEENLRTEQENYIDDIISSNQPDIFMKLPCDLWRLLGDCQCSSSMRINRSPAQRPSRKRIH